MLFFKVFTVSTVIYQAKMCDFLLSSEDKGHAPEVGLCVMTASSRKTWCEHKWIYMLPQRHPKKFSIILFSVAWRLNTNGKSPPFMSF